MLQQVMRPVGRRLCRQQQETSWRRQQFQFQFRFQYQHQAARAYAIQSSASPTTSPFAPRHFLSIADLSPQELSILVLNGYRHKQAIKSGSAPAQLSTSLSGKTIAMTMSKRSTRTRVSTEAAIARLGGHAMFLGKDDIQLGVNESLRDTAIIISSMTSGIFSRVHAHSDVAGLAKYSTVPVINSLSDDFHPLQTVADYITIYETFSAAAARGPEQTASPSLGLDGLKLAWVGDANNVLYDLAIGAAKLGVKIAVATPRGYEIPERMRQLIQSIDADALTETNVPEEALREADVVVTDTWISMGQEAEKERRLRDFAGFQLTSELIERGAANQDWRFMHCLPRHPEEVDDEVFYGPRSLVFPEAENRLYSAIAVLESFVVNQGNITLTPTTAWRASA